MNNKYMKIYSKKDYEEAYYSCNVLLCKEIGMFLLSKLKDNKSKELIKELNKIDIE